MQKQTSFYLSIFLLVACLCFNSFSNILCAQIESDSLEIYLEEKDELNYSLHSVLPSELLNRNEVLKQLAWSWQEIGPMQQPTELNPGGKAIPAYAEGRGNGTGRINYLMVHPKYDEYVWACSPTGGVWYTKDQGLSWLKGGTDKLPISGVSSIAVHPKQVNRWVIATGDGDDLFTFTDGLYVTSNEGLNYISINGELEGFQLPFGNDMEGQISDVMAADCHFKKFLVASNRGLWMSNGSLNPQKIKWKKVADGHFYDLELLQGKGSRKNVLIASGNKLVMSFDGGRTWEEMPMPDYPDSDKYRFLRMNAELSSADREKVFVVVTCSEAASNSALGECTLQFFDLPTRKWQLIRSLRSDAGNVIPTRARAFSVSPANASVMMCGNVQPLYRSTDGGISFSKIEKNQMHDDCHLILFTKDGETVWASHDGGVSVSFDGGQHFQNRDKGIGAANIFGLSTSQTAEPCIAYGGYDTGGNFLKENQWFHTNWGDGFETIIHPQNPDIVFTTMQNGGILYTQDGKVFESTNGPSGSKTEWHTWIKMHPTNNSTIYCSGTKLNRTRDLGEHWETIMTVNLLDSSLYNAYRFYLSEAHPSVMYVYILDESRIKPQIWRSFNITEADPAKIIWEKVNGIPTEGWIMNICVDPIDPHKFWLLYNKTDREGKIWWYDGSTYADYTANMGGSKCESMVLQRGSDKRLYVGSNYGVFTRSSTESQWTLLSGLPGTYIKSIDINYISNKLVVGTFGRGVWWGDLMKK